MGHFALGFQALFRVWTDDAFASQVGKWLGNHPTGEENTPAAPAATAPAPVLQAEPLPRAPREPRAAVTPNIKAPAAPAAPTPAPSTRNDALSLLSILQRDARLLDFLKEPINGYSDAEVGASVRAIHKEAAAVIERIFGVEPLSDQPEGATVEVPAGYDPVRYRLVGKVPGAGTALRGTVVHPGWKAVRADVPAWNGKADATNVLAPTEVEF